MKSLDSFLIISSLIFINLLQIGQCYPIGLSLLERGQQENNYYAPVTSGQVTISVATTSINPTLLATNTFTSVPYTSNYTNGTTDGSDGIQNKGFFSVIGKFFKSLFHIGESATTKALKKALPILEKAKAAKALLPAQKFYTSLSTEQKSTYLKLGQSEISKSKSAFQSLKDAAGAAGTAYNVVSFTTSLASSSQD
ncbi:hypothetical protein DASC09_033660 [Saccharomycopsis crataegensis]|uniref:Uncharacterized protein n=1 Tax=Saccharomycopsis crataegensis TaxID=43959 RepID=A0AAV5QMV8_9ASCO|nr:hypothetical protein DASC09_033660 [Saccharomycopsis crataegensis]